MTTRPSPLTTTSGQEEGEADCHANGENGALRYRLCPVCGASCSKWGFGTIAIILGALALCLGLKRKRDREHDDDKTENSSSMNLGKRTRSCRHRALYLSSFSIPSTEQEHRGPFAWQSASPSSWPDVVRKQTSGRQWG
jgi:hypothetical protein